MSDRIDLFLGSGWGGWALAQVRPDEVGHVLSVDPQVTKTARALGYRTLEGPTAALDFESATIGLSLHYPSVFPAPFIRRYRKLYNLHPGYLPWGRGYYPVFWALWEGTPAGATLHEVDAGIDTGPIVAQIRVCYSEEDTGGSLYERVRQAERHLFREYWPRLAAAECPPVFPQQRSGSYHDKKQFFACKRPPEWRSLTGSQLVRLTRALTFPGFSGLEIESGNRIFELQFNPLEAAVDRTRPPDSNAG